MSTRESKSTKPAQQRLRVRVSFPMDSPAAQFLANASSDKMRRLLIEGVFERHFLSDSPSPQSVNMSAEVLANAIADVLLRKFAIGTMPAAPTIPENVALDLMDSDLDAGGKVSVRTDVQFDGAAFAQFMPRR